uniref:Dirigent protein n=1 Tax=Aegilops tauschii TaxID=37682 RepID=N1QXY9_AEGTA
MVFQEQDSRYKRSTLQVMGMIGPEATGEWAIVGGTGKLSMARGIIKYKFPQIVTSFENYRQLDIHAFYTPQAV